MSKRIIAIDGYSSCGKSSTAKLVAKKLNYRYIDTGAMYRAVTLYFLDHGINESDPNEVADTLKKIQIFFVQKAGASHTYLNGKNVEELIRTMNVSKHVSKVATIKLVRDKLVDEQKTMGSEGAVVMDGRDIGTNVFPNADLKIFMTADTDVRAKRRLAELRERGNLQITKEEVITNLLERDKIDSSRKEAPLRKAQDAIELDTTNHTLDSQVDFILSLANK